VETTAKVSELAHACGGANYIETVWGRGYVLRDPEGEQKSKAQAKA